MGQILRLETNPSQPGQKQTFTCPPPLVPSTLRAFLRMGWAAGEGFGEEKSHVWV